MKQYKIQNRSQKNSHSCVPLSRFRIKITLVLTVSDHCCVHTICVFKICAYVYEQRTYLKATHTNINLYVDDRRPILFFPNFLNFCHSENNKKNGQMTPPFPLPPYIIEENTKDVYSNICIIYDIVDLLILLDVERRSFPPILYIVLYINIRLMYMH